MVVVVVVLPDPVLRIGAWWDTTEPQEPSYPPRASPKIKVRTRGPEDSHSGGREGGTRGKQMGRVVIARITKRAARRNGPANPSKVRIEKKAMSVATKTRKVAADRTR